MYRRWVRCLFDASGAGRARLEDAGQQAFGLEMRGTDQGPVTENGLGPEQLHGWRIRWWTGEDFLIFVNPHAVLLVKGPGFG